MANADEIEHRTYAVELRSLGDSSPRIVGHAANFDVLSEELTTRAGTRFRERIERGAFSGSLVSSDVRALWNHDANVVLGRTKSGTLRLSEDDRGLAIEIDPPDTQAARDLMTLMKRGDVDQMSFGFRVRKDDWKRGADGKLVRSLLDVELLDVSPVTYPAYISTDVAVRSMVAAGVADAEAPPEYEMDLRKLRLKLAAA